MNLRPFPTKQSVMAPTRRSAAESLGRRWLKDGCGERQAMMTRQSEESDGLRRRTTGEIRQEGTTWVLQKV